MPPVTLRGRDLKSKYVRQRIEIVHMITKVPLHELHSYTPADGLPAREVSDVDKGVVERGKDVRNAEHQLAVPHLELTRFG